MTHPVASTFRGLGTVTIAGLLWLGAADGARAAGAGPGGMDLLHVPISWCPVIGSPAQATPNIAGDTATDDILWRRHERPTDNIYINTAGITFRSAINNAWTVLDFPQIADPNTALATPGDMRGEDVNAFGAEFNAMINACDAAYAAPPLNRANIGITSVNAGLFHDAAGNYVTIVGWGGCSQPMGGHTVCGAPYDGRIAVVDNRYLHPGSPDRTWPGTTTQFTLTDPLDVLVGHELGHALGLDHISNTNLLMNPGLFDNTGDGQIDNIAFAAGQVAVARGSSQLVQGLEVDPPMQVDPGDFVADRLMDGEDKGEHPLWRDLASVKVTLDKNVNRLFISNKLNGIHEGRKAEPTVHWIVLDTEADAGAGREEIGRLGLRNRTIDGAEVVIRVEVRFPEAEATAWVWNGERLEETPRIFAEIQTLVMHPLFAPVKGMQPPDVGDARIYDTVVASLPAKVAGVRLGEPLRVDVLVVAGQGEVFDRLSEDRDDRRVVLENPDFPHCFALDAAKPGGAAPVEVEGLLPEAPFHALVGPDLVATGTTDNRGHALFDLPIPEGTRDGLHLVTVGVDDTALTADCAVQVGDRRRDDRDKHHPKKKKHDPRIDLLRRHQELLKDSLDALMELKPKKH